MGQPIRIDTEHPEIEGWIQRIEPDAELTRLTEAYTAADDHVRSLEARRHAAQTEIAAIDETIGDLAPPAMDKALAQRSRLAGLLAGVPSALAKAERSRIVAHLAWLAAVRARALAEAEQALAEVEPLDAQAIAERKHLNQMERAKVVQQISQEEWSEQQEAYRIRQQERHTQAQPARDRLQRARLIAEVCQLRGRRYGDTVRLDHPHTWDEIAITATRPTTLAARALVPA